MPSITNLGHQGWLIHGRKADVLVDPIVTRTFGNSENVRFEVWPPRVIDRDGLRDVGLIVLTNEHLDHFHIESLRLLRSTVERVLIPPLFPYAAESVLNGLGYSVHRTTELRTDDVELEFLSPDASEVPVWEARCCALLATDINTNSRAIIQSDTLVPARPELSVDIFVATNNSQLRPEGWQGLGLTNLLDDPEPALLEPLRQLGSAFTEGIGAARFVTFSGGGYRSIPRLHAEFKLPDSVAVARYLNATSVDPRFVGLLPGQTLSPDGAIATEPWVRSVEPLILEASVPPPNPEATFQGLDQPALFTAAHFGGGERARGLVMSGLKGLERTIAASDFGNALVDTNERLGNPLASDERFVVVLRTAPDEAVIARYDIGENAFRFESSAFDLEDLLFQVPFGMCAWLTDMAAVFSGKIQIWELLSTVARQWWVDDPFISPAAFLYAALSEGVSPDLAAEVYSNALVLPGVK